MPTILKNPRLNDYFVEHDCMSALLAEYEAGKIITLPKAKLDIDHDFWASLPVSEFSGLKKTGAAADGGTALANSLKKNGVPPGLTADILRESERVHERALPIYE